MRDRLMDERDRLLGDDRVLLAEVNRMRAIVGLTPLVGSVLRAEADAAADRVADKRSAAATRAVEVEADIRDAAEAEALEAEARGDEKAAAAAWDLSDEAEQRRISTAALLGDVAGELIAER